MIKKRTYYLSEGIGTFFMMLIGLSAITLDFGTAFMANTIASAHVRLLLTGILFAGGATLIVYSPVGRISGAHLNPAVTLAFFLKEKLSLKDAIAFMIMQILGSIAAALLVRHLWGAHAIEVKIGMTLPGAGYSVLTVFLVEVFITFLLVSAIFFFLHKNYLTRYAGIAAGVLIAVLVYLTANITGTSLNPARSIGPALAALDFSFLWIYLTAPMVGSIAAVSVQYLFFDKYKPLCAKLNHKKERCLYENCEFSKSNR